MKTHLRMIHLFKRARKLVEISKSHISCGISLALSSKTSQLSSRLGQRALLPNDHHLFLPLLIRKSINSSLPRGNHLEKAVLRQVLRIAVPRRKDLAIGTPLCPSEGEWRHQYWDQIKKIQSVKSARETRRKRGCS